MSLVDISHVITAGMVTYPGLPGPEITPHLTRAASRGSYAPGVEFAIDRISMVGNTGTYVDSPYHRYEGGVDLADLALESVADVPIVVVRLADRAERGIDAADLDGIDAAGAAVLLHTGWDRHWGTPGYGDPAPYLTESGATWLVAAGVTLVGIDSVMRPKPDREAAWRRLSTDLDQGKLATMVQTVSLGHVPRLGEAITAGKVRGRIVVDLNA